MNFQFTLVSGTTFPPLPAEVENQVLGPPIQTITLDADVLAPVV